MLQSNKKSKKIPVFRKDDTSQNNKSDSKSKSRPLPVRRALAGSPRSVTSVTTSKQKKSIKSNQVNPLSFDGSDHDDDNQANQKTTPKKSPLKNRPKISSSSSGKQVSGRSSVTRQIPSSPYRVTSKKRKSTEPTKQKQGKEKKRSSVSDFTHPKQPEPSELEGSAIYRLQVRNGGQRYFQQNQVSKRMRAVNTSF